MLFAADDGRRLRLPVGDTRTLKLAYAISVHKAQGSQMPVAVIPLFRGHHLMLTRNLLYTAVTRSERVTVLVGDPSALELALSRRDAHRRNTRLAELVAQWGPGASPAGVSPPRGSTAWSSGFSASVKRRGHARRARRRPPAPTA